MKSMQSLQKYVAKQMIGPKPKASLVSVSTYERLYVWSQVMDGLRELGLFGLQIPEDYGGLVSHPHHWD